MLVDVYLHLDGVRQRLGRLMKTAEGIVFQYADEFLATGLQVSPFAWPRQAGLKQCNPSAGLLPGFIDDALPDTWGNALWALKLGASQNHWARFMGLECLTWMGRDGMGALEFEPAVKPSVQWAAHNLVLPRIAKDIERVFTGEASQKTASTLLALSGFAGGSRPKIACWVSDDKNRIVSQPTDNTSFTPWLVKFRSPGDKLDLGVQEYVSSIVAKRAGIDMPTTHLFVVGDDAWFGVERFDRQGYAKRHRVSVAGLLDCDERTPFDYVQLLMMTARLSSYDDVLEQFRRAVFNYSIGNCDDHAKNFSFLMDAKGQWRVSPAYDLVTSEAIGGEHMTTVCGRAKNVGRDTFYELAKAFKIPKREATLILDEVADAVSGYDALAKNYGVRAPKAVRPI